MGIYKPNLDKYSSKFQSYRANEYEVQIAVPKLRTISFKDKNGADAKMHMLQFPSRIISAADGDTEFANKPLTIDVAIDFDREDGFDRALKFFMATQGIKAGTDEGDAEFRTRFADADLSVDPDNGTIGTGWLKAQDCRVIANMSQEPDKKGELRNRLKSARPFNT